MNHQFNNAASEVDVARLMRLAHRLSTESYVAGATNLDDTGDITEKEQAALSNLETALRVALAQRGWVGLTDAEIQETVTKSVQENELDWPGF